MKARELLKLGIQRGPLMKLAQQLIGRAANSGLSKTELRAQLRLVITDPENHLNHTHFAALARELASPPKKPPFIDRDTPAPWRQWGKNLDGEAVLQLQNACRLPIATAGALMPDAHLGYGLPIGGVLATDNSVIPYAVGVDIACRMRMTITDMPVHTIVGEKDRYIRVIENETRFGIGAQFRNRHDHEVLEADWGISPITERLHGKAWRQLGTSGSGNHFVEIGILTLNEPELGLKAGRYVALLSHSGSRGPGNEVARHFSQLAMKQHPELPRELKHLAWLELDAADGQEYWAAMQLMGQFAKANHELIHYHVVKGLRAKALAEIENHHNFAWKEQHGDREVIVHRKGATPASTSTLGIIPGSMATPGYVVRGKGNKASLESASHGAGRVMSRKQAKKTFTWSSVRRRLDQLGITVLSAGVDEVPGVYKDIEEVMAAQKDLVTIIARFDPKIVKMAPAGERPED